MDLENSGAGADKLGPSARSGSLPTPLSFSGTQPRPFLYGLPVAAFMLLN